MSNISIMNEHSNKQISNSGNVSIVNKYNKKHISYGRGMIYMFKTNSIQNIAGKVAIATKTLDVIMLQTKWKLDNVIISTYFAIFFRSEKYIKFLSYPVSKLLDTCNTILFLRGFGQV